MSDIAGLHRRAARVAVARLVATIAVLLAAGCSKGSGARRVNDVAVMGNRHISDGELIGGLETHRPQGILGRNKAEVDQRDLDEDAQRIETYYEAHGFFSARVEGVDVVPVGDDSAIVRFRVFEGEPTMVSSLEVRGAPEAEDAGTAALIRIVTGKGDLAVGERFDHAAYVEAKKRLGKHLVDRGFAHAAVGGGVRVDPVEHTAEIVFEVDAGPRAVFGPLTVEGLERIPEEAVRARVRWEEGARFDRKKLGATKVALHRLGVFSTITVDYDATGRPESLPMRIAVNEAPRRLVRFGVGAGVDRSQWEVRGRAGYAISGLFHPLSKLTLEARPAYAIIRGIGGERGFVATALAKLERQDLVLPFLRGTVEVTYSLDEYEAYTGQGPGLHLTLQRPWLDERLQIGVGYRFRVIDFIRRSAAIDDATAREIGMNDTLVIGQLEQTIAYDGRDNPISPRLGFWVGLRFEQSGRYSRGELPYGTMVPEVRGYVPLGGRLVLAARGKLGVTLWGDRLPITQRFFSGGATNHRGFGQRRLSPVAVGTTSVDPFRTIDVGIGGTAMVESSIEARLDMFRLGGQWLVLAGFADAADVTLDFDEIDVRDLHVAAGGGLRYRTPIGPVRFDVGVRLNRTGEGEPAPNSDWAFHLTLGEAF